MGTTTIIASAVLGLAALVLNVYTAFENRDKASKSAAETKQFQDRLTTALTTTVEAQKELAAKSEENKQLTAKLTALTAETNAMLTGGSGFVVVMPSFAASSFEFQIDNRGDYPLTSAQLTVIDESSVAATAGWPADEAKLRAAASAIRVVPFDYPLPPGVDPRPHPELRYPLPAAPAVLQFRIMIYLVKRTFVENLVIKHGRSGWSYGLRVGQIHEKSVEAIYNYEAPAFSDETQTAAPKGMP